MCQWLVAEKNYTLVRFISESNQSKESRLIETGTKRRQKATSFLSKKLLLLSEIPYMLKHRCCQSVKSPIVLAIRTFSFYQDTHIFFSMTSRVCLLEGHHFLQPLPMSPHLNQMWWLCWDTAMTTLAATTPVLLPPATRIVLMYKNEVGFGISSLQIAWPTIACVCNCNRISWAFEPL